MQWQGRIAPTPSGYLHLGNAYNFMLSWLETRCRGGKLRLRIDDLDRERVRPEYVDDIFRQLDFIGLDWDYGPQSPEEHEKEYSQTFRIPMYRQALQELEVKNLLFPCSCTRSEVQERNGANFYKGHCLRHTPDPNTALSFRYRAPAHTSVQIQESGELKHDTLGEEEAFPILLRKDGIPAYQLASLVDDIAYGTNLIVRGEDLWQSTKVQLLIAQELSKNQFRETHFIHHQLLEDSQGLKLSKSQDSPTLKEMYSGKSGENLWRDFIRIAKLPDLEPKPDKVLAYWKNTR